MKKLKTLLLAVMIAVTSVAMCINVSAETTDLTDTTTTPEKITASVNQDYYQLNLTTTPDLITPVQYPQGDNFDFDFTSYTKVLGTDVTDKFFAVREIKADSYSDYTFRMEVFRSKNREDTFEIYHELIDEFTSAHNVPNTFKLLTDYSEVEDTYEVNNNHYIEFTCQNGELFENMWIVSGTSVAWTSAYPSYHTFSSELRGKIAKLGRRSDYVKLQSYYNIQLKDYINTDEEAHYVCEQAKSVPGVIKAEYVHVQTPKEVEYTPLQLEIMKKSPMAVGFMPDSWYLDRVMPRYNWSTQMFIELESGNRYDSEFYERMQDLNLNWDRMALSLAYFLTDKNGEQYHCECLFFYSFDDAYNALAKFADVDDRGDYWVVDNAFNVIEGNKYHITNAFFNEFDDNGCYVDEDVIKKYLTPAEIEENLDEINAYLTSKNLEEMTVPSVIGNANDNLSPNQVKLIRDAHQTVNNKFMPDRWFVEKTDYNFSDCFLVYFVDGYELNPEDFWESNIKEIKRAPEFDEEYGEGAYVATFDWSHQATSLVKYFTNDRYPAIERVVGFTSFSDQKYVPTAEDIEKYGIIGLSEEEEESLLEKYNLNMKGDMDGTNTLNVNDVVYYLRQLSTQKPLNSVEFYRADLFIDKKVDVLDLVSCVYKILE